MNARASTGNLVKLTVAEPMATLTLNRPDKLNALTWQSFTELRARLDQLAGRPDVRCLVLRGEGRAFCAGLDLDGIAPGQDDEMLDEAAETLALLESFRAPTIARIHGHCLTGGLELALACDILVCSDDAQLGDTHGRWGLVPVLGMSVRLPARVGLAKAMELSFTGHLVPGTEAAQIGLVNASVPADELDAYVAKLSSAVVGNSPEALRIMKSLYRSSLGQSWPERLAFEHGLPFGRPADAAERVQSRVRR